VSRHGGLNTRHFGLELFGRSHKPVFAPLHIFDCQAVVQSELDMPPERR
jgi:hypothetical protein